MTIDPELYRPSEVNILQGDASKAQRMLGWSHRIGLRELVWEMLVHDCQAHGVSDAIRRTAAV